jgi:hypothetical protein
VVGSFLSWPAVEAGGRGSSSLQAFLLEEGLLGGFASWSTVAALVACRCAPLSSHRGGGKMEVVAWTESSSIICDFVFFGAAGVCYCSPLIFLTKVVWSGVKRWRLPASLEKAGEIRSRPTHPRSRLPCLIDLLQSGRHKSNLHCGGPQNLLR